MKNVDTKELLKLIRFLQQITGIQCKRQGNKIGINTIGPFAISIYPKSNSPAIKIEHLKNGDNFRFIIEDNGQIICKKGTKNKIGDTIDLKYAPNIEKLAKIALYKRI